MNLMHVRLFQSPGNLFETIFGIQPGQGNLLGEIFVIINGIIATVFALLYSYQVLLAIFAAFARKRQFKKTENLQEYTFLICARNEENVIGQIINSIKHLDYPQEKIRIHVVADNCTDKTAQVATSFGATVFERFDDINIGKSYALDFYFKQEIARQDQVGAGYIIVDADNVFDKNYLTEINKAYVDTRQEVIAAYRSSSNPGYSLASFGSAYSFLRESTLMHKGRSILGLSAYVSGTGFFVARSLIEREGGWKYHLLIEDIQFSLQHVLDGQKTLYVHDAIFYDEQPRTMRASMRQRVRWVKGLYQCFAGYQRELFKTLFTKKQSVRKKFSTFEALLFVTPAPTLMIIWFIVYGIVSTLNLAFGGSDINYFLSTYVATIFNFFIALYVFTTTTTLLISIVDWRRIKMNWFKKLVLPFFSFFFLITYIPILLFTPFMKVKWKPVKHYGVSKKFK